MSAVNSRRAPPSRGGLARLVSKFENLGTSSNTNRNNGATYEAIDRPPVENKLSETPLVHGEEKDGIETSRAATSPSPAPIRASPVKHNDTAQPRPVVKDTHIRQTTTPSFKPRKPLARSGSVVAEMRRLFERGSDENTVSNNTPATYEPTRVASPTTTNECNDHKTPFHANSRAKESSKIGIIPTDAGDLEELDQQEEKDAVPDLIPFYHHVEHPECLPRPLASPDRSSQRSEESNVGVESKTSIWQRGTEHRFKLQGGAFLHKTPSPLKNMIVTGIGAWHPKTCSTSPEQALHSENGIIRGGHKKDPTNSSLSRREGGDLKELHQVKSPLLKVSRSVPLHQSKVSNLRKKFDGTLQSSAPARYTSRVDGSLPAHSMAVSAKRGLKETIGLFESLSHQTNGEDELDHIPKAYSSPIFLDSNGRSSNKRQDEKLTTRAWDVTPVPRLLSPLESGIPRSYSQSPDMGTLSSQASDVKPLLYTKPSVLKASRYRGFGSIFKSDRRRKMNTSSEDAGPRGYPEQRRGFNVDSEGGFDLQSQYGAGPSEEVPTNTCESFPVKHRLSIVDRHPSLRLLSRRLVSRSHGLFVSQAHCTLEQPQPIRGGEIRRITSLCKDRMAALRARPQTE
ncbi:hypothetical protein GGI43DRAFT_425523 [Trichoderma evansii]